MPTRRGRRRTEVTFAGQVWELDNPDAYGWLLALRSDPKDLSYVFPGMTRERDLQRLLEASTALDVTDFQRRCVNTARVAITRSTGWDWWRCLNLANKALDNWTITNGMMLLDGCDANNMDFSSWLSAAYVTMVKNLDKEDRLKFEFEVNKIPMGARAVIAPTKSKQALMDFAAD